MSAPATPPLGRCARAFRWCTDPVCSRDGLPSFPKLMACAIYWAYVAERPVPVSVAALLIATSFGYKAFSEWLGKASFAISEAGSLALAHKVERHVEEKTETETHHTITEVRGPAGEALRSLPPVDGARTPAGEE